MSIGEFRPWQLDDALPGAWLVKRCEAYKAEYKLCKSWAGRFQQNYIFGENSDCQPWRDDFDNCMNFRKNKDEESLSKVIESEMVRREARLSGHRNNDIWEKRKEPPKDWNKPLPPHLLERQKNSKFWPREDEKTQ